MPKLVFLAVLFLRVALFAFETDSFTRRHENLAPADSFANAKMRQLIFVGVSRANSRQSCDPQLFVQEVRKSMGNWILGKLEHYLESDENVPKHSFNFFRSFYGERGVYHLRYPVGLRAAINVNNQYVGVDKFDHFVDQGYDYYKLYKKTGSLSEVFRFGRRMEETYFGGKLTGVISYADLVANFEGLKFWLQLAEGKNPYFRCEKGQWRMVREFTWSDYVNAAWDEAVNCSSYDSPELERTLTRHFTCPVNRETCQIMAEHYGVYASELLHPSCLSKN